MGGELKHKKQVALYLDKEKAEALQLLAERKGTRQQEVLRAAIDYILEHPADFEWERKSVDGRRVSTVRRKRAVKKA